MVLPITNPTKSFWIEGANSELRNHRTTAELPKDVDVAIVGSGYTGTTMAYWLLKFAGEAQAPSTLILEARDVCGGATGRNGGQLRPHAYSRYPSWAARFGADGAHAIIKHEMAHLEAFDELLKSEGIPAEEVSFKLGNTFDAAMTQEAWDRLKGAYEDMKRDHGADGEVIRDCYLIEDPKEAEEFSQMKGCIGAVVHPAGQVWPYKFVHAILRKLLATGKVNLQSNTPALNISEKDSDGKVTIHTERGDIKAKAVIHATNRWASHLLPDFGNLIFAGRGTLAAIKAPEGFLKHTGAQHWDSVVNNYHLQLPPPHNSIIIGGAKPLTVHKPRQFVNSDREDLQFEGVPQFYAEWPKKDVAGWKGDVNAEFEKSVEDGGCWSGVYSSSIDGFPFVGPVPCSPGHFVAAGFSGHGMPRILGSTAHLAPLVLSSLKLSYIQPPAATMFPPLPEPFHITEKRVSEMKKVDAEKKFKEEVQSSLESAKKAFSSHLA